MAERVLARKKPLSRQNVGKMGGARAVKLVNKWKL